MTKILEVKNRIEELKEEQKQKLEKKTNLTSNKEKFEKELAEKETELAELSKKLSAKELEIEVSNFDETNDLLNEEIPKEMEGKSLLIN